MSLKRDFISWFIKWSWLFVAIASLGIISVYALNWYDSFNATTWETLSTTKWNNMTKSLVPSWSIMAFNLTTCPAEWTPADWSTASIPDLRWQFLRWMNTFDNWATTRSDWNQDPTWARALRNYQADIFGNHNHWTPWWPYLINWPSANVSSYWWSNYQVGVAYNTSSSWWVETRPKNVAVIFCVKN